MINGSDYGRETPAHLRRKMTHQEQSAYLAGRRKMWTLDELEHRDVKPMATARYLKISSVNATGKPMIAVCDMLNPNDVFCYLQNTAPANITIKVEALDGSPMIVSDRDWEQYRQARLTAKDLQKQHRKQQKDQINEQ